MESLWLVFFVLCAAGLAQSVLMLLHAFEHRRYHRSRWKTKIQSAPAPRVTLFVPCKGVDLGMDANLRALFEQRFDPLEICFLVESDCDPAVAIIRRLQPQFPEVSTRIVRTGVATNCGQKVHNLLLGTQTVSADAQVLAFVDSDARPHSDWLSRLVDRLRSGKFAVATGYRWYAPVQPTFVNRLLSAINNTVVGVMGPHGFNLVWGGAWAIRAESFRALGLPEAWRGSLSDDLVVSRLVHDAALKVAYEPHCLVQSPAEFSWSALAEFLRRQYVVVKVYAPRWWWFAVASNLLINLSFWGLVVLAALSATVAGGPALAAVAGLTWIYLLTAVRAALAAAAVRPFAVAGHDEYGAISRISVWGWPLVTLVIGLGLAASSLGRTIVWRGMRYRLDSLNRTTLYGGPVPTPPA